MCASMITRKHKYDNQEFQEFRIDQTFLYTSLCSPTKNSTQGTPQTIL